AGFPGCGASSRPAGPTYRYWLFSVMFLRYYPSLTGLSSRLKRICSNMNWIIIHYGNRDTVQWVIRTRPAPGRRGWLRKKRAFLDYSESVAYMNNPFMSGDMGQ